MKEARSQQLQIMGRFAIVPAAARLYSVTNTDSKSQRFLSMRRTATSSNQLLLKIRNSEAEKMYT